MPVKEIRIEDPSHYEAVDVISSSELKEVHKRYGGWMKGLSGIVKKYYTTKGSWQALWTIATRTFGFCYNGHSLEVAKAVATSLADEMHVDPAVAEDMAEDIYKSLSELIGERKARGQAPETMV